MQSKLSALASKAGQPLAKFAESNIHTDGEVGRLARLYYNQQTVHGGGKASMDGMGDQRSIGQSIYQIG